MPPCPEDPVKFAGQPIGMYHCPDCGCMQVAGIPHMCDPEDCLLVDCDCLPPGVHKSPNLLAGNTDSSYQTRVQPWMTACFGPMIAADVIERHHRFLEEALELVQATGCTRDEAHSLVEYVYDRPVGEIAQEVGGVMVTLAALCLAHGLDMHTAGETELARVWTKIEQIRAKQAAKPKHGPLP